MEEYSYTSTHPLGHTEPLTGKLYLNNNLPVTPFNGCTRSSFRYEPRRYLLRVILGIRRSVSKIFVLLRCYAD